jgi:hypothetical protein
MKETMRLGDEDQDWNFEALMNTEEKGFQKGKENEEEYFFFSSPFWILFSSLFIDASKFQPWSLSPNFIASFIQILGVSL